MELTKMNKHNNKIFLVFVLVLSMMCCMIGCSNKELQNKYTNNVELSNQSINLKGVSNARQIGGYYTSSGKKIKQDVLLRSGALSKATEEDIISLKDKYKLKKIIDLRTTAEISKAPDCKVEGAESVHIKVMSEDANDKNNAVTGIYIQSKDPSESLLQMYRQGVLNENMYSNMLKSEDAINGFKSFFDELIKNEDGSVLWHCTGGKDRAGMATVLIMTALGVDQKTIIEDFALTNEANKKSIAYMRENAKKYTSDEKELDGVATLVGVAPEYMQKAFEYAQSEYGSMLRYIQEKLGVTDKQIRTLRKMYLE